MRVTAETLAHPSAGDTGRGRVPRVAGFARQARRGARTRLYAVTGSIAGCTALETVTGSRRTNAFSSAAGAPSARPLTRRWRTAS
jgi:hypothetical protein